jgi:hypothetical protein
MPSSANAEMFQYTVNEIGEIPVDDFYAPYLLGPVSVFSK